MRSNATERRMRPERLVQHRIADVHITQHAHDVDHGRLVHGDRAPRQRLRATEHVPLKQGASQLHAQRTHRARFHPLGQHREAADLQLLHRRRQLVGGSTEHIQLDDFDERQQHVQRWSSVVVIQRERIPGRDRACARVHHVLVAVDRFQQLQHHRGRIEHLVQVRQNVLARHVHERDDTARQTVETDGHHRMQRRVTTHDVLRHRARLRGFGAGPVQQFIGHPPIAGIEDRLAGDVDGLRGSQRIRERSIRHWGTSPVSGTSISGRRSEESAQPHGGGDLSDGTIVPNTG